MSATADPRQDLQADAVYELADKIAVVVEQNQGQTWSPSQMARKIGATTLEAQHALRWMDYQQDPSVAAIGNGSRTRYGARCR